MSAFTLFHVVLSLVGIGSGFVVLFGLLLGKGLPVWTSTFLSTTVLTRTHFKTLRNVIMKQAI
jgi:hypothetical protein